MKFSIIYEAQMADPSPASEVRCFQEIVEQVVLAEEVGFDNVWCVEHTALTQYAHMSAPETMVGGGSSGASGCVDALLVHLPGLSLVHSRAPA